MKTLSLGAGKQAKHPGLTQIDISKDVNPDIVWDLTKFPYPIESKSFQIVECNDVIEHLDNIPAVLEECHRVLTPGGILRITTPHFSCSNSYIDPTHKFHLSYFSFDYFTPEHQLGYYSKARFAIHYRRIFFEMPFPFKGFFERFANRWPKFYEKRLAWVFPAHFLYFELKSLD